MIRVCLVDDQTLVRQGVRSLLALDDGIEVVAEAGDGRQAVELMDKSRSLAENSVSDAEAASQALDEINRAISLISDMSTQIATAAEEQTKVTEEITANVTAIKEVGDELAAGAEAEQQESARLQQAAHNLNDMVSRFVL